MDEYPAGDASGVRSIWGRLYAHDAAALDTRLDAMARTVCDGDPRDIDQRRSDALGALGRSRVLWPRRQVGRGNLHAGDRLHVGITMTVPQSFWLDPPRYNTPDV